MPGGDRTGPMGMGPRTGWGAGYCSGFTMPGYRYGLPGRGMGMGFGRGRGGGIGRGGRGWRNMFYATGLPAWMRTGGYAMPPQRLDPDAEKQMLKNQAEALQSELDFIKRRLDEIGTETPEA